MRQTHSPSASISAAVSTEPSTIETTDGPTDSRAERGRLYTDSHRFCPGCGTEMFDRGCKVRCPRCGFFLDCSDG